MEMKIKASEKDKILSILSEKYTLYLSDLDGDKALNILIAKSLKEDGLITIRDLDNDNMLVTITNEGKAFISRGGYSIRTKQEQKEKWKKRFWSAFCYLLGVITTLIGQYVLTQLIHLK